mmetsp:Transcript_103910/g.333070  ORF Transcript_103910/g.333070 Transcript_103910/m.333070 type:complete len:239 (+) Transcript_103910:785-1501(+)
MQRAGLGGRSAGAEGRRCRGGGRGRRLGQWRRRCSNGLRLGQRRRRCSSGLRLRDARQCGHRGGIFAARAAPCCPSAEGAGRGRVGGRGQARRSPRQRRQRRRRGQGPGRLADARQQRADHRSTGGAGAGGAGGSEGAAVHRAPLRAAGPCRQRRGGDDAVHLLDESVLRLGHFVDRRPHCEDHATATKAQEKLYDVNLGTVNLQANLAGPRLPSCTSTSRGRKTPALGKNCCLDRLH